MIFGNLGKMGEMLKQAKEMQKQMASITVEKAENGLKVKVSGEMEITAVEVTPAELPADPGRLAETIRRVVNGAFKEAKMVAAKKLGGMAPGAGLPW
jgi:DNA-binding protein YbaB